MRHVIDNPKFEYLGCTIEEFKVHIESQFREGMSWANIDEIHFDHIKALGVKGLTEAEIIERLHYTNIQPLWPIENMRKKTKETYIPIDKLTI